MKKTLILSLVMGMSFSAFSQTATESKRDRIARELKEQNNSNHRGERRVERRARRNSRRGDLRVGDIALLTERENVKVEVINIERNGKYALKFLEGSLRGRIGGGWDRSVLARTEGCGEDFCIGDRALNTAKESVEVEIVGIQEGSKYVLKYLSGSLYNRVGQNWTVKDLAEMEGCTNSGLCIGDQAYNIEKDSTRVQIIGIAQDDKLVLKFLEGSLYNRVGGGWTADDLATTTICGLNFCPGDEVYHISRSYQRVEIMAVDTQGRYVIKFLEGSLTNRVGGKWSDSDFAEVNRTQTVGEQRRERLERTRRGRRRN